MVGLYLKEGHFNIKGDNYYIINVSGSNSSGRSSTSSATSSSSISNNIFSNNMQS